MFVDMPAHAIADSRSGKEASQRTRQTANRNTSGSSYPRHNRTDSAAYRRAGRNSTASTEVSGYSTHAAANGSTDFLDSRYQEQFFTAAAFRAHDFLLFHIFTSN